MAIFTAIAYGLAYAGSYLAAAAGLSFATAVNVGLAVAQIGGALISAAISRLLAPSVSIPRAEIQAVINQTEAPRRIYIGENLAGGIRALFDVKDGILYQLVLVSHGKITEFSALRVDGREVELDALGVPVEGSFVEYLTCKIRDGAGLGGNYNQLLSNFTYWNTDRKLTGQATFLASLKAPGGEDFSRIFPKAYNTSLQWVIKGQAVYDPRTDVEAYSDNAALAITHFLTHPDGYKLDRLDVNWPSVEAMAKECDIPIPQLAGGTAPSLRLWGYWTLDEGPIDVLDRMHGSSGIRAYEMQDGTVGLIGGRFGFPSCTITAKDIREIQTNEAISEREGYNVLRVFHLDASQNYELTEVDAWRDEDRLTIEGEIVQEYRMEMCPNRSQARHLAKQQIYNDNRARVEIITNLVGLKARFPAQNGRRHTINLDYRPEDGSGRAILGEYEVLDHEFDPVELECRIELAKVDRASDERPIADEGAAPTPLPEGEGNFAPPISAVLTQRIVQVSAGVQQAVLEVDAVPVAGRTDITLQARYRRTGATAWIDMQATAYSAQSGAVEDGLEYEAEARFRGVFDQPDIWIYLGPITIRIDSTAPGAPIDLNASNGMDAVALSWRNPATGFFTLRVYRSTGTDFNSADLIGQTGGVSGQISEFQDATAAAATDYTYWIAAANVSGVEGAPTGPATITTP